MSDYNLVTTRMELGAKLSKLEGGEAVDSNTNQSLIRSLRYLICTRPDIINVVKRILKLLTCIYHGGRKPIHGGSDIPSLERSEEDSQICQVG
jgi:hypothetical protein